MGVQELTGPLQVRGRSPVKAPGQPSQVTHVQISGSGTIGRRPDNAFTVNDPTMSGRHARIDVTPQGAVVTDLGSRNGVLLGHQRVQTYTVTKPTVFGMGSSFIEISPDGGCSLKIGGGGGELVGKDLTFSVNDGKLRLLDGISFKLPGNELLAVVGPSGAGKSTLLKALTDLAQVGLQVEQGVVGEQHGVQVAVLLEAGELAHARGVGGALQVQEVGGVVVQEQGDHGLGEQVRLDRVGGDLRAADPLLDGGAAGLGDLVALLCFSL